MEPRTTATCKAMETRSMRRATPGLGFLAVSHEGVRGEEYTSLPVGGGEERRAPETSVVRRAFDEGWPRVCDSVPQRVKREASAYQRCGDVRYGFSQVTCEDCAASRLVAFCCKGRGWCPSCTNRRAVETGVRVAALVPQVGHRQWTLSLPFTLRFLVVKRPSC